MTLLSALTSASQIPNLSVRDQDYPKIKTEIVGTHHPLAGQVDPGAESYDCHVITSIPQAMSSVSTYVNVWTQHRRPHQNVKKG
jgi:hypothetical protein